MIIGPGDDCALVKQPGGNVLLKADAIVQDVHFTLETEPRLIGRKALARAISDIGAMGGTPRHALVTVVLPPTLSVAFIEAIYEGMNELATEFQVSIVGGETSKGRELVISVALSGDAAGRVVGRSGASAGDVLFVTGQLGGSIHGKHLNFTPRVREAQWLAAHFAPTAMMDVSDGLAKDLPRLARASRLEFVVDEPSLPCSPGCTAAQAWGDGEDYELLFAIDAGHADQLKQAWSQAHPHLALTKIGRLVAAGEGCAPGFASSGWDHFAKP